MTTVVAMLHSAFVPAPSARRRDPSAADPAAGGATDGVGPSAVPNSVLGRVFLLLGAFGDGAEELSLAELSRRTGIPKPTAFRLLRELAQWGAVERRPTGIRLGMRLFELGQLVPRQRELREAAAPFLADLFDATQETVHLAVPEGVEVVYVQKIEARRGPTVSSRVGGRMPAYCTGVGKVLLAFGPPERFADVVAAGLVRRTPRTIVGPGLLRAELDRVRERGVAFEYEESAVGTACVAAPVFGADGRAIAAVSITGWASTLDPGRFASAVRTAALGVSRTLRAPRRSPPVTHS